MLRSSADGPSVFDVSPFDGGWSLKIQDTGEVLFFKHRRQARARAMALAQAVAGPAEVQVRARSRVEAWPEAFPYPLGAPI